MKEAKPTPSSTKPASWIAGRLARALFLAGGIAVVAGAAWFAYRQGSPGKDEILVYRLCVGHEQKLCPNDATFVRNQGDDTLTQWAQKQCTGYKRRRIIVNDGPTKDCDCSLADVTCSSE
jgi:hypothetical protein